MDKKSNFRDVLCKMHNNHEPHTFDYLGEYLIDANTSKIENNEGDGFIYQFNSFQDLYQNILDNLDQLDLTSGGDDQFFDYNPAITEAIIYGLYQLQFSDIDTSEAYDKLYAIFQKYWDMRKTEELDLDDNDSIYESLEMDILYRKHQIASIKNLEVAKYLK